MSLFEQAIEQHKQLIIDELERRVWERLEPRIQQELHARYMTVSEVARYLHVCEKTVRRLLRDGELPSFRVRSSILIRQQDVDAWIERQIIQGE
ncbi:MAG: helix-turn-helix domain-containing protein [Alicyclobacillus sp.]|nr:helix-turn-helix domain-containing protein [Alicyclobacillus sp.]